MKTCTLIAGVAALVASQWATAGARTDGFETLTKHFNFHAGMPSASKVETNIMDLNPRPPVSTFVRSGADNGISGIVNKGTVFAPPPNLKP